jgi:dolichol-phosphate mannosyltransferase
MSKETVTICMPVLNEAEVIHSVLVEWIQVVSELPEGSHILIEDGGSTDGTTEILRNYALRSKHLKIIYRQKPEGFGKAARSLLSSASTHWVFFTDSDGQYVANDFWKLWHRRENLDLVRGIKLGRKDPLFRRLTSYIWNRLIFLMFQIPLADINVAFFLVKRDELEKIISKCKFLDLLVVSEVMIRLVTNNCLYGSDVYILHRERSNGKSRAIPARKLISVGLSHFKGLRRIKTDFRINY